MWYVQSGPRSKDTGKFRSRPKMGTSKSDAGQHCGWHYEVIAHHSGTSVKRMSYNVAISDQHRSRVEYLRGFSNANQAATAAKDWIEQAQRRLLSTTRPSTLGAIPTLPEVQEK